MQTTFIEASKQYQVSGHGRYACQWTWLIKVAEALKASPLLFANPDHAIVELGVIKSMLQPMRFWGEATGLIEPLGRGQYGLTEFGRQLLSHDSYLEAHETAWLLHWKIGTNPKPLLAWDFLLHKWHREIEKGDVIEAFRREMPETKQSTLEEHFAVFIKSYCARDNLDDIESLLFPFLDLNLVSFRGELPEAKRKFYVFNRSGKQSISPALYLYCLHDFWQTYHANESTLTFKECAHGYGSPGQLFKMSELETGERVGDLENLTNGIFEYRISRELNQIYQHQPVSSDELFDAIYQ